MKSFSQFLQESYLYEEIPSNMSRDEFNRLPSETRRRLTGSDVGIGKKGQTLTPQQTPLAVRAARKPSNTSQSWVHRNPNKLPIPNPQKPEQKGGPQPNLPASEATPTAGLLPGQEGGQLAGRQSSVPAGFNRQSSSPATKSQNIEPVNVRDITDPRRAAAQLKQKQAAAGAGPSAKPVVTPPPSTPSGVPPTGSIPRTPSAPSGTSYRNIGVGRGAIPTPSLRTQPQAQRPSNPNIPSRMPGESTADLAARRQAATQARMGRTPSGIVPTGRPPSGPSPSSIFKGADTAATVASSAPKVGKFAKLAKFAGPASTALDVVTSAADERAKGSGWFRSLAKGATVAAGGLLGGTAGSVAGPVGSIGGAIAGGAAAEKAFDTVAGANARERAAMAKANRQRQAGSSIKGIGGPTTFSKGKGGTGFMSTGVGSQRKTVQLAKTGEVQRGGQSVAGHLAFITGPGGRKQAVYKAGPSAQSLAQTSSNPLERIGRSLFAGAYKQHDIQKQQQALAKARQSDIARNKALGEIGRAHV